MCRKYCEIKKPDIPEQHLYLRKTLFWSLRFPSAINKFRNIDRSSKNFFLMFRKIFIQQWITCQKFNQDISIYNKYRSLFSCTAPVLFSSTINFLHQSRKIILSFPKSIRLHNIFLYWNYIHLDFGLLRKIKWRFQNNGIFYKHPFCLVSTVHSYIT